MEMDYDLWYMHKLHKKTLDHMTQLLGKVRKVEQYHEKRIYIPRVKE